MTTALRHFRPRFKSFAVIGFCLLTATSLSACSTNPATGERQFAGLMSPQQESSVGAQEHAKVLQTYSALPANDPLQVYVDQVGAKIAANTERPDVQYKFFVLDDPMVNAFALPGGYVYVTRGLLAHANSEAELAAVLAHEVGHITGRHSAERYSQGVVTSLGAAVLSAALDSSTASQALGLGSQLYIKSYSRGQEHEADELGVRYLVRAGYDKSAMASFLRNLERHGALENKLAGRGESAGVNYFSTHPLTADRVAQTKAIAASYQQGQAVTNHDGYLRKIDGIVFGDSAKQGFIRGQSFYHTQMDFMFTVPNGFVISNQPDKVAATNNNGTIILFDAAQRSSGMDAMTYVTQSWMKSEPLDGVEKISINGKNAATASFSATIGGQPSLVRVVAVEWSPNTFYRFQMAMPVNATVGIVEGLKRTTYSLRPLTGQEKANIKPHIVKVFNASAGDTAASLGNRMPFSNFQEERFRVLNGLDAGVPVQSGTLYKTITE